MSQKLLNVKQVAALLGVGKSTIWRWAQSGKGPKPIRLTNGCTRWRSSEVTAFIEGASVN